jgi:hypothetical protein
VFQYKFIRKEADGSVGLLPSFSLSLKVGLWADAVVNLIGTMGIGSE